MVPHKLKISAIILFLLAILLFVFFDISKHNPLFAPVNPFGDDPYDAVSTFALQGSIFFALLAVFRAFRHYPGGQPGTDQVTYLVRAQMAASLTLLTALASDLLAMGRYASRWAGSAGGIGLMTLTGGSFLLIAAVSLYFWLSAWKPNLVGGNGPWGWPAGVTALFILTLLLYPAPWRERLPGALGTVIIGAILLFMMVWAWGKALSPDRTLHQPASLPGWMWGVTIVAGGILGLAMVLREIFNAGTIDLSGKIPVIMVFICLEITGILIGLAFLGNYLGLGELFRKRTHGQNQHR